MYFTKEETLLTFKEIHQDELNDNFTPSDIDLKNSNLL